MAAGKRATRITVILVVAVVVIVGAIAGIAIYRDRVTPFRTVILKVDGTSINMRYFLKRVAMSGEQPMSMLQTLMQEQIIKQTVMKPPYNITASEQDIDQFARDLARGNDESIDEGEFREWYRQQLNETRLSEAEFRELLRTALLSRRMGEYLAERVPTAAEQVFVNMIPVKNYEVGTKLKEKYDEGEDFAALALEYSVDPALKENGGKVGWFPRGVLDTVVDLTAFELKVGESSNPFYIDEQTVIVIMISERTASREIDEQSLRVLKSIALEQWLIEQQANHEVEFHGFSNGYDSETDSWVNWQLMRMQRGQPEGESSG